MRGRTFLLMALLLAVVVGTAPAQLITSVTRRGSTNPAPALGGVLQESSLCMVDRTHVYKNVPAYLAGQAEYVIVSNVDRNVAAYELDIVLSARADVYLFIDYRVGDDSNANPPTLTTLMTWVAAMGFVDTGDQIDIDENNDGSINQYFRIYKAQFAAGTVTLLQQNDGTSRNMYGVAAVLVDPTFNPPPSVNAGPDHVIAKPVFPHAVQLDGTVTDEDPLEPDPGQGPWELSMEWSLVSGPTAVEFSDATIEDPTVTITTPGTYVLQLYATDTEKDASDTVTLYVNDPSQNQLMAHWDFEAMQAVKDAAVLDVANGNDGVWVTDGPDPNALPNIIPGWITGSTQALELNSPAPSHINVTISDTEPNFVDGPRFAMTISSWIKVDQFSRSWANVVSKGDDSWKLVRQSRSGQNNNAMMAQFVGTTPGPGQPANGPNNQIGISVNDNLWHHVCGTYDGERIRFYVDGVLDCDGPYTGLINTSSYPIQIGGNSQQANRMWDGALDDVRVYNYALDESAIRAITALGKVPPYVSVEPFAEPIKYKWGELVPLQGSVADHGEGGLSDVTILWTTVAGPEDGVEATFTDPTDPATTVSFPQFGAYTLRLTAIDAGVNAEVYAEIDVELISPTCQDVIDAGLLMVGDVNQDCRVNLEDFAILAANWALCNDPTRPQECLWPFAQE